MTFSVLAVAAAAFLAIPASSQAAPRAPVGLQDAVRDAGDLVDAQIYIGPGGVAVGAPRRAYRDPYYRGRGYGAYGERRGYGYRSGYRQPQCRPGWSWQSGRCKPYRGY
jgi:hypothetical protein